MTFRTKIFSDLRKNFRYDSWLANGIPVFQRVLTAICGNHNLENVNRDQCQGFAIFAPTRFYPVIGSDMFLYFNPNATQKILNVHEKNRAVGLHFWNSRSQKRNFTMGNGDAYDLFSKQNCPLIYKRHKQL